MGDVYLHDGEGRRKENDILPRLQSEYVIFDSPEFYFSYSKVSFLLLEIQLLQKGTDCMDIKEDTLDPEKLNRVISYEQLISIHFLSSLFNISEWID